MTTEHYWTASDGARLFYRYDDYTDPWREAPLVVLIHPGLGSSLRLYGWVPHLARHYRVVRPDIRGHGKSEPGALDELSHERLAKDLTELLDHLAVRQAHVMGSSAGGMIAAQTALRRPERFKSLALYSATAGIPPARHQKGDWLGRVARDGVRRFLEETAKDRIGEATAEKIRWYLDSAHGVTAEYLARYVPVMASVDFTEELTKLVLPVLVVVPDPDPMVARSEYERLCAHLNNYRFVTIPNAGHGMSAEIPDRCAEIYKTFLQKLEAQ